MDTYIVAKVTYINSAHLEDRDMDSDDDETNMKSHIQEICFATDSIPKIFELITKYPFGDNIDFEIFRQTPEKLESHFNHMRIHGSDTDTYSEEIGAYFEDGVAKYFIVVYSVVKR